MTATLLAGCLLLAYGPPAVLLLTYASRRSALLILTIASAFVWLLAIFLTSIVWIAIPPLKTVHAFTVVVSVLFQEAARLGLVWCYTKSEKAADQLVRRGGPKLFNDFSAGIAAGLGFGIMHTVIMYGAVLGAAGGEAAYYLDACPHISVFTWTATVALFYNVLHVALMILAIDAYRRRSWLRGAAVLAIHLLFGLLTIMNDSVSNGCIISLVLLGVIAAASCALVAAIESRPDYNAKRQQRAWQMMASAPDAYSEERRPSAAADRSDHHAVRNRGAA